MQPWPRYREEVENFRVPTNQFETYGSTLVQTFNSFGAAEAWVPDGLAFDIPANRYTDSWTGRKMNDFVVPDFRKRITEGEVIPTNPLSIEERLLGNNGRHEFTFRKIVPLSGGRWQATWRRHGIVVNPAVMPNPVVYDTSQLTSARAQMQSGYMDALTTLAEFHKVIEMIVGFKQRVKTEFIKMARAWARDPRNVADALLNFLSLPAFLKMLSTFWLEYRFGWRLLYFDYLAICEIVNDLDMSGLRRPFRSGKLVEGVTTRSTRTWSNSSIGTVFTCSQVITRGGNKRGGCLGDLRIAGPLQIDPLTTAWEILPLSLVLDMFWNIGDVIAAYSPFGSVTEVDAWLSGRNDVFVTSEASYSPPGDGWVLMGLVNEPANGVLSLMKRDPSKDFIGIPAPDINVSGLKAVDLGALSVVLVAGYKEAIKTLIKRSRI